jgi:hypothetical protein
MPETSSPMSTSQTSVRRWGDVKYINARYICRPRSRPRSIASVRSGSTLRRRWQLVFGRVTPAGLSKDLLGRMMAARLQERAFGGLDRDSLRFLESLARFGAHGASHLPPDSYTRSRAKRGGADGLGNLNDDPLGDRTAWLGM